MAKAPSTEARAATLESRRTLKMAESAHAYVRGATESFYKWLRSDAVKSSLPSGPDVWICGDCHTGNLGPVADVDGRIGIQIRDLDQTVIGNPAHDLVRLGLSLAMAARSADLPGVTTARMLEEVVVGYAAGLDGHSSSTSAEEIEPIRKVMKEASNRRWQHLAEEHIEDVKPQIPLGRKYWALTTEERDEVQRLFHEDSVRRLLAVLCGEEEVAKGLEVVDAAYWMKGCSSLGKLRYAVLISVGRMKRADYRLIDIKEAVAPAAPSTRPEQMPADAGERVVAGARQLSPFLGERMLPLQFSGKPVVLRELRPQDLKFELDRLTQKQAINTARLMACVVGRAHGRQMLEAERKAWHGELRERHSKGLDAPRWLWSSILDLAALHEAAYLEHCRRYALAEAV